MKKSFEHSVSSLFEMCEKKDENSGTITVEVSNSQFTFSLSIVKEKKEEIISLVDRLFPLVLPGRKIHHSFQELVCCHPLTLTQLIQLVAMGTAINYVYTYFDENYLLKVARRKDNM